MDKQIVIWSPDPALRQGTIVSGVERHRHESTGVILLPVEPELLSRGGVGGYCKREWGDGLPMQASTPRMYSPMTVFVPVGCQRVHWTARFEVDASLGAVVGQMMLTPDPSQPGATMLQIHGAAPMLLASIHFRPGAPLTLRGQATIRPEQDGLHGFALYGAPMGVRLLWSAVTVTP